MKIILLLLILITGLVSWGQDYSQNLKVFTPENKDDSIHVFTFKLPDDAYHINVSINPNIVPDAMYVKYGNEEFWSGFVGEDWNESFLQRDLSLEEKRKILSIQKNSIRNSIENKINYTKPDSSRIQGGTVGEVYYVKNDRGRVVMYIKKIDATHYRFRGKKREVIFDNPRSGGIGKVKYFDPQAERWIFKSLNLDPSRNRIVVYKGVNTKRIDFGKFTSSNIGPSSFYYGYFRDMNPLPRNFNGELIVFQKEQNLLDIVNSKILSNGGVEVSTLFTTTEEKTIEVTSSIIEGSGNLDDYKKNSCGVSSGTRSFQFSKKEGVSEITIIIFSPLKTSDDLFELSINQSPEGLNYTYYDSGQLKEKYTLQKGEYHGEYLSYYENTSFNPSMNKDNNPWEGKIKTVYTYFNGQKTGVHKEFDKNEKLALEEELIDGVRNGSYKKHENGQVKEEGTYLDDKKNGEWKLYSYNGKEVYNYSNDLKEGAYYKYHEGLIIEKGIFVKNKRNGTFTSYNADSTILIITNYIDDLKHGYFFENSGDIYLEGSYKNGYLELMVETDNNTNEKIISRFYNNGFLNKITYHKHGDYELTYLLSDHPDKNISDKLLSIFKNRDKNGYLGTTYDGVTADGSYIKDINKTSNYSTGEKYKENCHTCYQKPMNPTGVLKRPYRLEFITKCDIINPDETVFYDEIFNLTFTKRIETYKNGKTRSILTNWSYSIFDENEKLLYSTDDHFTYLSKNSQFVLNPPIYSSNMIIAENAMKKVLAKGHCNKDPYYKNGHVHDTDISLKCGNCDSRIYEKCCNVGDPRDKNQEKEFTCNSCGAINIVKFSILRTLRRGDNF